MFIRSLGLKLLFVACLALSGVASAQWVGNPYLLTPPAPAGGTETSFAFDITGMTYASNSADISGDETSPRSLHLSADGDFFYAGGTTLDGINEYPLSTDFDLSTKGASTGFLDTSSETVSPGGMDWKKDGTIIYIGSQSSDDDIYQYDCSTAWDLDSCSYASKKIETSGEVVGTLHGIAVSFDGAKVWALDSQGTDKIHQYGCTTPWDLSTCTADSKELEVNSEDISPVDMEVSTDGTKLVISGNGNNALFQYTLSTANDISTGTYDSVSVSVGTQDATPLGLWIGNSASNEAYTAGAATDTIYKYD